MINDVLDQLYPAKFRGVPFLFTKASRQGGRKTAIHEFPNTNHRYVEDLGLNVPMFDIDATITGTTDYVLKRDRFIKALEKEGPGLLSHPFYGDCVVQVIKYTLDEDTSELGKAKFSINFAITGDDVYPSQTSSPLNSAFLRENSFEALEKVPAIIFERYVTNTSSKAVQQFNTAMVLNIVRTLSTGLDTIRNSVDISTEESSDIESEILYISENKYTIADDSDEMTNTLLDPVEQISTIDVAPENLYSCYSSMFKFQSDTVVPVATTVQKKIMQENYNLITGVFNIIILIYAYGQAAQIDYFTSDDVNRVREDLETQFTYILSIDNLDYDLLSDLRDIRTQMNQFFNEVGKQVFKISTIKTQQIPLAVLTYQYYGDLNVLEQLRKLNNVTEPSFIDGDFNLFTE